MKLTMQGFVKHGAAQCVRYLDDLQGSATMDIA